MENSKYKYNIPDCYIYFYHTDEFFIIPTYPESVTDNLSSNFQSENALSRTAPTYSWAYSGPRTLSIDLDLYRDMMNFYNTSNASVKINVDGSNNGVITSIDDDYIDILLKKIQAIALPKYQDASKAINPPKVAVRLGNEIFIKGVVNNGIRVSYKLPMLANNKYAHVGIGFTVDEVDPYDADSVGKYGSFRGLTSGAEAKMKGLL